MKMVTSKELRRQLGAVLRGKEAVLVLRRGRAAAIVLPAASGEGEAFLASRQAGLYEAFVGHGHSGEATASQEHDAHLYA